MVDPGGYNVPRFEDRRAEVVVPEWRSRFGAGSNVASNTDDGLLIDELTAFLQAVDEKGSLAYNAGFFNTATGLNLDNLIGGLFGSERAPDRGSTGPVVVYGDEGTIVSPANDQSEVSTPRGDVYGLEGPVTLEFGDIAVFIFAPADVSTSTTMTLGGQPYGPTFGVVGTGFQVAQSMHSALPSSDFNIVSKNDVYEDPAGNGILVISLTSAISSTITATNSEVSQSRGVAETLATSVEPGDIPGQEGQLTTISTPISGWLGVVNLEDVTPGALEDTDAQYRQRHLDTLGKGGTSTLIAVLSILRDVKRNPGVEYVQILQNLSLTTDAGGRPGKSFEVFIEGGLELTIVTLIWENHPLGIQTFGEINVLIEDTRAAGIHQISYTRPTKRHVWIDVTITTGEGFPSTETSDIEKQVSDELVAFGKTLGIGRDVYLDELRQQLNVSGSRSIEISIGATSLATSPKPDVFPTNLTVNEDQLTVWDITKISTIVVEG